MRQEAINTKNGKPAPSSVTLGRWVILLRQHGVMTPIAEISNTEIDLILARVDEMAREKKEKDGGN